MTIAEIRTKDKIDVCIHGHSGYAKPGSDIICAGISSLAQAFSLVAENATIDTDDGFLRVAADLSENNKIRLSMFEAGLKAIADEYPQYLEIFSQK